MLNQTQFMRQFNETHREDFNPDLFHRENQDIVNSIEKIVRSCERDKYFTLKVLSFDPIYNYEQIYNTLRYHEEKRRKKGSKVENSWDYITINETDMILIKVRYLVRHNGSEREEVNGKTVELINPEQILEVLIAVPRFSKKYYFKISGKYYSSTYQIVDGSTYNNANASNSKIDSITMKTNFMPIRIFRSKVNLIPVGSKEPLKSVILYSSLIFGTRCDAMLYLFAHFGFYGVCEFLGIRCVSITKEPVIQEGMYSFMKHNLFVNCPIEAFNDPMVQSFVCTCVDGIYKDTEINDAYDIKHWLSVLGKTFKSAAANCVEKGLFVLDSVDSIYDNITKEDLHLPIEDKDNIFCVFRWLLREFPQLRAKENTDVRTKRIRIADYIGAVYATKLNKGMHRISDMGRNVTLRKVIQAVYTPPMYVINQISATSMSNLVAYRDMVNDNDATVALKYTYKGISGLGEDGTAVQPIYRHVDPTHVGILDLDTCSTSDPGMSGMICPMTQIFNHSFSQYQEPNTWYDNYAQYQDPSMYKPNIIQPILFEKPLPPSNYMNARQAVSDEYLEISKIKCPIYNVDPSIDYTVAGSMLKEQQQEQPKSLFTIRKEDEDGGFDD